MKIEPIRQTNYNISTFKGCNITKVVEKLSMRDFYGTPEPTEFIALRKIYSNLWKNLSLPENLKPRLQYKAMFADMSFSLDNYIIYVEKRMTPFKMELRNKTGKNESILRHEIEHIKQFWDIIRLLGSDNFEQKINEQCPDLGLVVKPALLKKIKEIEQTLGRITPESKEGQKALEYIEGLRKYPDLSRYGGILDLREIKQYLQYKNNILEKRAIEAEKKYEPSLFKEIKIAFKSLMNLLFHSQ